MRNVNKIKNQILILIMLLCVTSICAQENYWNENFNTVSICNFKDGTIGLEKKVQFGNVRSNPDGTRFYKTIFAVIIESNGSKTRSIIESDAYTTANKDNSMTPCMLIDINRDIISIFSNSKASDSNYGMDGFVYRIDMNTKKWTKEVVYSHANYGWFSFFGGSNNGNPELCHFSYAGYYSVLSIRDEYGRWSTQNMGSIKPDFADRQYLSHKNILATSYSNIDRMKLLEYNNSYSSSNSNTNAVVGTLVVGAAIYGLYKLFTSDNSTSVNKNTQSVQLWIRCKNCGEVYSYPRNYQCSKCQNKTDYNDPYWKCPDCNSYRDYKEYECTCGFKRKND